MPMKRWRILVNGTNFKTEFAKDGGASKVRRIGFYTTVFVTAKTANEAKVKAVALLRADKKLRAAVRNAHDDPPVVFADEIEEVSSFRGRLRPRTGFTLYVERGPKRKR